MPTQPDPYVAFLSSIQDALAASSQPNTFAPGAQGVPAATAATGDPGGVGGSVGGASVPGTATTGPGVLESIVQGGISPDSPAAANLPFRLGGGEAGDLGAGVTGGDVETLLSVMGGPLAIPTILGTLVAAADLGLPPTTNPNALLNDTLATSLATGREVGGNIGGPAVTGTVGGTGSVNAIRSGSIGLSGGGVGASGGGNAAQFDTPEFGV